MFACHFETFHFLVLGRQLKLEGDNFRQKLNTQHIFDDWIAQVQAKNISLTGRVFIIEKRQKDGKIMFNLKVNFSNDVVTLFKEVSQFSSRFLRVLRNLKLRKSQGKLSSYD